MACRLETTRSRARRSLSSSTNPVEGVLRRWPESVFVWGQGRQHDRSLPYILREDPGRLGALLARRLLYSKEDRTLCFVFAAAASALSEPPSKARQSITAGTGALGISACLSSLLCVLVVVLHSYMPAASLSLPLSLICALLSSAAVCTQRGQA